MSSRFIADRQARADAAAIYAFDGELARAPHASTNPIVCEMRLAWWSEALDEIFEGRAVRRHPIAEALAEAVMRRGLARGPLDALIDARDRELDPRPFSPEEARAWALGTGGQTAEIVAGMLDPDRGAAPARSAGGAWALGRRLGVQTELGLELMSLRDQARDDVRRLSAKAFPAVAHAALAGRASDTEFGRRLRVTWAVLRGRI